MVWSLWIIIILFCTYQAKIMKFRDTAVYSNIVCPSSESCQIICFGEESCSNIDIHCSDNDYECSIHCNTNACQNARIVFTNARKSEVICSTAESCRYSEIYIEPKNATSTVFIDIHSHIGQIDHIQINYKGNASFPNDHQISTLADAPSISIHPITILCRHQNSCSDTAITISSLNYFKLHCLSNQSCYNLQMDFISYNEDNRGELDIVCNGEQSCYNTHINAITAHTFEMICDSSVDSCGGTTVQCPIHSSVQSTENSCVLHCMDDSTCSGAVLYAMYGSPLPIQNITIHCGYEFDKSCDLGTDCNSICGAIESTDHIQLVLPFNDDTNGMSTQLQCDMDAQIDICVLFISTTAVSSIHCGNATECMVICMDYTQCGGTGMIVNGTAADILSVHTLPHSFFQFIDIYGPMNGEFISHAQMNATTLYLSQTKEIEMICSSEKNCVDVLIFANDTNAINLMCSNPSSCRFISVFVNNMWYEASNISPIPYCKLHWDCSDGCMNNTNKVFINLPHPTESTQCDIHTPHDASSNEWFCDEYSLSTPCILARDTTDYPISSTQFMDHIIITRSRLTTDWMLDTVHNERTFWRQSGGLFGLGIVVLCCCGCVVGLICTKNAVQKKIAEAKNEQNASHKTPHHHHGSTVEEIIQQSAALPFTNPLELQMTQNIHKRSTLTASIISSPSMPPMKPPEDEQKQVDDEGIALQYGRSGSIGHCKQQQRVSDRSIASTYVYGHPQGVSRMTMEGSMDMESRLNRCSTYTDVDTVSSQSINLTSQIKNLSAHDIGKQRTFSSPSLVVLSIYENESNANNHQLDLELSSDDGSDGMYESMSTHREEGGKPTTTTTKGGVQSTS
eukprot:255638_1